MEWFSFWPQVEGRALVTRLDRGTHRGRSRFGWGQSLATSWRPKAPAICSLTPLIRVGDTRDGVEIEDISLVLGMA
jgi:hypothetical protein